MERYVSKSNQYLIGQCLILTGIWLFLSSCSGSGVQGTALFSKFQGVNAIEALSPTTVKLTWGLDSKYSEYRIYENNGASPVKSETFGTTTIVGLQPKSTYSYQVSGYSTTTGEQFSGDKVAITTFPNFVGLQAAGVVLKSSAEIQLSWDMNAPTAKYRVYYKNQTSTWNKTSPYATVENQNKVSVSGLIAGQTYCFFIEAEYLDASIQPVAVTETELNTKAICKQLTTSMPSIPSVSVSSVTFGDFPWFWAANGDPTYKVEIYDKSTNIRVASKTGNGYFRSTLAVTPAKTNYYALISNTTGDVAMANLDVVGQTTRATTITRKLTSSGQNGPVYPPILSDGKGAQNLGSAIVGGDFNCDGLPDIAVAAKTSVPMNTIQHYNEIGAVTIYYTYEYVEEVNGIPTTKRKLKTDVAPSATAVAPNPQLIYFPVSENRTQFGTSMISGNFNGDCYQRDFSAANGSPQRGNCDQIYGQFTSKTAALIRQVKKCDDLAVSTSVGSIFVMYGDPNNGLVSGSGSNTFGIDEQTCDSVSSTCRTSQYVYPSGFRKNTFGRALAAGDFNNDGFDDLVVSAVSSADGIGRILIYRGDSLGVFPYGSSKFFAAVNPTDASTGLSVSERVSLSADDFGFSLTAVRNSRLCEKDGPAGAVYRNTAYFPTAASQRIRGLDVAKCADLVIGAPSRASGRGSIYTCRGIQPTSGDKQLIQSWTCKEHYPNNINGEAAQKYGYSLLGVANQNGYPVGDHILGGVSMQPNVWGALFVGAPGSTVAGVANAGSVYGYYVTKGNGENSAWGIQTQIGGAVAHTVLADNSVACDQTNQTCLSQRITAATPQAEMQFGTVLSSIQERAGNIDQWMPMLAVSAPYRDNVNTSGQVVSDSGAVYLYRGDISNFMNQMDNGVEITEPVYNPSKLSACNNGNCTWLSGGISPFGETLIYNKDLQASSLFGIGGSVGVQPLSNASFNDDNSTDIFVSAPYNNLPTANNGGVYGFYSSAGSFSPTVNTPDLAIQQNSSLEGNYHFEEARVVGDINGDGYEDVITHINSNNNWVLVIYYGSANGLVTTPAPSLAPTGLGPKMYRSTYDNKLGEQFFPIGDVNGDGFADILALSSSGKGSYIFYGSSTGLVTSAEPDISPVGKNPLRFAVSGADTVRFSIDQVQYLNVLDDYESYNNAVQAVSYGKFNNDIYDDIVIRTLNNSTIPVAVQDGNLNYGGYGRVYIIYGSSTGPKINNTTGKILLQDAFGNPADVVTTNPCDSVDNSNCKVQMLSAPTSGNVGFGYATARRKLFNQALNEFDGLLVSAPLYNSNDGRVYVYEGGLRGLNPVPIQNLTPRDTGTRFGYSVTDIGDVNADLKTDIAISANRKPSSSPRANVVTIFYGQQLGGKSAYGGDSSGMLSGINYWTPAISDNQLLVGLRPQVINPISASTADLVGFGLLGLGDINNDGYADLAINVPNGDYTVSGNISQTGYVLVYFGGMNGLQINSLTPTPYPKCHAGPTIVCEPYQVFVPNFAENDFTHINPFSTGDVNGDGVRDLLIGVLGRSHPSGKGISTGVIHVMY